MLDPNRPYAYLAEREPHKDAFGNTTCVDVNTIFLTASRCPVGCAMCDLHLNTLPHPTLPGSIPEQIEFAKRQLPRSDWVKLYNSGNFFDPASIPVSDYRAIAKACEGYQRIIVENHPRFGLRQHRVFRDLLSVPLEIAVGLETVQPRMLARLGKKMTRDDFGRYAKTLHDLQIDLRVFLIVGAPGLSVAESFRWTRLSIRHAIAAGVRHISMIPARKGHGWNGAGDSLPQFQLSELAEFFSESLGDLRGRTCLSIDLWDFDRDHMTEAELRLLHGLENAILEQQVDRACTAGTLGTRPLKAAVSKGNDEPRV